MAKKDLLSYVLILIVALFLTADLFLHPGRSITFDGHVHITTIAQFYNALKDGEFPAQWAHGFANYGLPIPIVAHQTTSYLGAFFQFFTHNPVLAYNLVTLLGVFLSSAFLYRFLRYYFKEEASLVATVLFNFAPYRIANMYIRGALPELFASVFVPVVLIGLHQMLKEKKRVGMLWIILGTTFLALTHPMMLVISGVVLVPYAIYLLWPLKKRVWDILRLGMCGVLGILIAGYYVVPLTTEIWYFSYGRTKDHFRPEGGFFKLPDFVMDSWSYFGGHPGPRANTLTIGSIEIAIFLVAIAVFFWLLKQKKKEVEVLPWLIVGLLSIVLMTSLSLPFYKYISLLNNIQYAWRNLSAFMFVPPVLLAWLLTKAHRRWLELVVILLICAIRIPQSYGKNFMIYDFKNYDFITANLHTNNMNTVWMSDSREYPVKTKQYEIIEGKGSVSNEKINNSQRTYSVHADGTVRMIDYTFYFPGWEVKVDGQPVEIQFQDPAYRGLITYQVPAGDHTVQLRFGPSKIRLFGYLVTLLGLISTGIWMWLNAHKAIVEKLPIVPVRKFLLHLLF